MLSGILGDILAAVTQRPFWGERRIREYVRDSYDAAVRKRYKTEADETKRRPLTDLRAMLFFISETRQNWLVTYHNMGFFVEDDRKWEEPTKTPGIPLHKMVPIVVNENWSEQEGVVSFGDSPKRWLYSKDLFLNDPPKQAIERFLSPPAAGSDGKV